MGNGGLSALQLWPDPSLGTLLRNAWKQLSVEEHQYYTKAIRKRWIDYVINLAIRLQISYNVTLQIAYSFIHLFMLIHYYFYFMVNTLRLFTFILCTNTMPYYVIKNFQIGTTYQSANIKVGSHILYIKKCIMLYIM